MINAKKLILWVMTLVIASSLFVVVFAVGNSETANEPMQPVEENKIEAPLG